jgi:hypothetical protein
MKFILSGEGPTDIGDWDYCSEGRFFNPGPMAVFIDIIVQSVLRFSPLDTDGRRGDMVTFINESELAHYSKTMRKSFVVPGKKLMKGTGFFTKNAQALGTIALQRATQEDCHYVAVLFRDSDGTRTRDEWEEKWDSIANGFSRSGFDRGVPMVPRKKSEAWLIAGLDNSGHQCLYLEERSGNDDSPNSLKMELANRLREAVSRDLLNARIHDGTIDQTRIQLPSYNKFKESLLAALL